MAKFNVSEYHYTGKSAMLHGYTKPIDTETAENEEIAMVKCESIDHGNYKIFVADTDMLYSRCGHVSASDKANLFEVQATVKVSDLTVSQLHWILAYCYYNQIIVNKVDDRLTVSVFETIDSVDEGDLSEHSQHFRVMFNKFNVVYSGIYYDSKAVAHIQAIENYNGVVKYFQQKSKHKSLTDKRYFCE
jgi:hypothetical protein